MGTEYRDTKMVLHDSEAGRRIIFFSWKPFFKLSHFYGDLEGHPCFHVFNLRLQQL